MYGVAVDDKKYCCIECARRTGVEPVRMLMHFEYEGVCDGCFIDLEDC